MNCVMVMDTNMITGESDNITYTLKPKALRQLRKYLERLEQDGLALSLADDEEPTKEPE